MVRCSDNAVLFHAFHDGRRAVIADLEAALDIGCRGLAVAQDNRDGLIIGIAGGSAETALIENRALIVIGDIQFVIPRNVFKIVRLTLRFEVCDNFFDFAIGNKRAVNAADATATRHEEHIALTEELLGTLFAQNGAAVNFGGDLKGDAGREICLDRAGDDIDRGALGGQNDVNAGGARHLCEALDGTFNILAGDHHEIGHLVDDDDEIRQGLQVHDLVFEDCLAGIAVKAGLDRAGNDFAAGFGLADAHIEAVNIADAKLGHFLVALFHLAHGPFEGDDGLFGVGDDGGEQMRDAVIDGEFEHFRIDHDQAALLGGEAVEQ